MIKIIAWLAALSLPITFIVVWVWAAMEDEDVAWAGVCVLVLAALFAATFWGIRTLHNL